MGSIPLFSFDIYNFHLVIIGIITLLAATIPNLLNNKNITAPILYVLIGVVLYCFSNNYSSIAVLNNVEVIRKIAEFVVLIALTNAGLKIRKPFIWNTWKYSFWLLVITMPLTIIASAYLSWWFLGFAPAAAILFGSLISPTDPVLASDLQTTKPSKNDSSRTRLALTSEAGINDGLAFPFTFFAIFMASRTMDYTEWFVEWLWIDLIYKLIAGLGIGLLSGWTLYKLIFSLTSKNQQTKITRGILSISLTLIPYGITELFGGYGFVAVFVAASMFSKSEKSSLHMDSLHSFTEEIERIFVALLFVIIGIYMAANAAALWDYHLIITALVIILVIRPISGWIALFHTDLSRFEKFVLSFYGIRGVGSIYYLMFALSVTQFDDAQKLTQLTAVTIIASVFIHGISAATIQKKLDKYDIE
ncbi:cation:proton antiporter [Flavobacterium kingsejongi]|uniref:Cation/H+ exchanger transmembrane domain-containing protein n=1 Tax=Flavobacterium kingsejongi TaxID=1678728 RepID=A0A2S1LQP5_9FLAO|nr:cation:proton antiporter [Flavobacterium kingsejongi]AWG26090.1 hypothetical protein FK004_13065 [Flavobacterium kingsejongi]